MDEATTATANGWPGGATSETGEQRREVWPDPPGAAALDGFPGELVGTVLPYTEADPAALLVQTLAAFGSVVGCRPHTMVGAQRHGVNLFAAIVGRSAKARKGDSWAPIRRLFELAEPDWASGRVKSGLSSGEGLVWQVRDADEKTGDAGESDKRLLVVEPEFSRVLKVASREGNILSTTLRDAWDGRDLGSLTTRTPTRATRPHVTLLAHVTLEELRRDLTATDAANGFGNRFLWIAARRRQLLPSPPRFEGHEIDRLGRELGKRIAFASQVDWLYRSGAAEEVWAELYRGELAEEGSGLVGSLTARSEAQVLRLSALYALLDGAKVVSAEHIGSAIALWRYSVASVRHIFGGSLGDKTADAILRALRETAPGSLARTEISGLFSRHVGVDRIELALGVLERAGVAQPRSVPTAGRPREEWFACA